METTKSARLSAADYDADLAERCGGINRALPAAELSRFVHMLSHRIGGIPAGRAGQGAGERDRPGAG
jgi:hypothetical protein